MKESIKDIIKRQNEVLSKPIITKKEKERFNEVMSGIKRKENIDNNNNNSFRTRMTTICKRIMNNPD